MFAGLNKSKFFLIANNDYRYFLVEQNRFINWRRKNMAAH